MGALKLSWLRGIGSGSVSFVGAWLVGAWLIGLTTPGCFTVFAAGPIGKSRGTSSGSMVLARKIGIGRSSRAAGTTPEAWLAEPSGTGRFKVIEELDAGATR